MRFALLLTLAACTATTDAADVPAFVVPDFPQFDFDFGPLPSTDADAGGDGPGGETRVCCAATDQCAPGELCRPPTTGLSGAEAAGRCMAPPKGGCWSAEDCPAFYRCDGAVLCSCEGACDTTEAPGLCAAEIPLGCCTDDAACGDGNSCVFGPPAPAVEPDADAGPASPSDADVASPEPEAVPDVGDADGVSPDPGSAPDATEEDVVEVPPPPELVVGRCAPTLGEGGCWTDADCTAPKTCAGATRCDCDTTDCVMTSGTCRLPLQGECNADSDCTDGKKCIASGTCGASCDPKDPLCCDANFCATVASECTQGADCSSGTCLGGSPCHSWCSPPTPDCCYGNKCLANLCVGANPQGCYHTGCGPGLGCRITTQCKSSSCTCDFAVGWKCVDDCMGGVCVPSKCPGLPPSGCGLSGCPKGSSCVIDPKGCVPSACECDEATGSWNCTSDCDGGTCVPD